MGTIVFARSACHAVVPSQSAPGRRDTRSYIRLCVAIAAVVLAAAIQVACGASPTGEAASTAGTPLQINGAGATFPYPIYSKWFDEYRKKNPRVQINYQSIGSGGGIRQLTSQTVFFGATDGPMTDKQLAAAPGRILHLPMVLGANVPIYNLPGVGTELKFTGEVLADIFLGKVTKWNDPALAKINAGVTLPTTDITVVHRSEASGTTYIWADFLAKASPDWKSKVGASTALRWPVGVGGKGNEGVAGLLKQIPGSIGYVELIYARQNKIPFGSVQNATGEFVKATPDSVTAAAAASAAQLPADFRVSITGAAGPGAYPISSFSWMLLYEDPQDKAQARAMVDFIKWALTDGQQFAAQLGYARLPSEIVSQELAVLERVKVE